LPDFIRAVEDTGANWSPRNNATIALKYYPERREVVAPVLVKALQDPVPKVRMCAAESLYRIAPDLITKAGVVPVVIGVLKNPDDQIAWRAASLLGQMRIDPALAVPALIESLENKSSLVASTAAQALAGFKGQAETIIPALEKATRREDTAGGWAKNALKQLESEPQSDQGSRK
jgi:HEAT repeat protein